MQASQQVIQYFLMAMTALSLFASILIEQWYPSAMFIVSVAAVVVHNIFLPKPSEGPGREEFEEMKRTITTLAGQLKDTTNKITGLRMSIGLKN